MADDPRKYPKRASRLDQFKPVIDGWLAADLDAPRKQRHTATRIFDRLIKEEEADNITYGMVRTYVANRRPQIRVERGRAPVEAFIPQPICRAVRPRSTSARSPSGCAVNW